MIPGRDFDPADAHPVRNRRLRKEWAQEHAYCMCCGIPAERAPWPGCSLHHLVRTGRSDEACNFLTLCDTCHRLTHGASIRGPLYPERWVIGTEYPGYLPKLTLGMQLELKRRRDREHWDPRRLEQLWSRHLPDLEAIPEVFQEAFIRNQQLGDVYADS